VFFFFFFFSNDLLTLGFGRSFSRQTRACRLQRHSCQLGAAKTRSTAAHARCV
jgi:hypothetical protein